MNAPIPAQRLAPPRRYFWTAPEVATLRRLYPTEGPEACRVALPLRTLASIYGQALKLGLQAPENFGKDRKRWLWTEAEIAELRRVYQTEPDRGAINTLAQRLGKPRHIVCAQAAKQGLRAPRFASSPWSSAEEAILRNHAHRHPRTIARHLRHAGFKRSETAIAVHRKRRCLDTTDPDHYTAHALAQLMGVDGKTVTRWIEREGLPAKRRGTARSEAQGGDHWWINRRALRTWIASHAVLVDLRKVERFWFLDLVFGGVA